jgi:hypothetical protein
MAICELLLLNVDEMLFDMKSAICVMVWFWGFSLSFGLVALGR